MTSRRADRGTGSRSPRRVGLTRPALVPVFLALLIVTLAAGAQPSGKMPRIGVLSDGTTIPQSLLLRADQLIL